jgi:hypothetical protein
MSSATAGTKNQRRNLKEHMVTQTLMIGTDTLRQAVFAWL